MKEQCIQVKDIPQQYFEVGQTVYSPTWGEGYVREINNSLTYPIHVDFGETMLRSFTNDGRHINSNLISLSQSPISPIINTPFIKFEEGELVFAYIVDCWILCHYYQPIGTLFSVYKSSQQEKLLYATEVKKLTDIPII